jgi:hypothetical protein
MNDSESGCCPFLETIWHSPETTKDDNYSNILKYDLANNTIDGKT